MSFTDEFTQQWITLCKYMDNEMIDYGNKFGYIDLKEIESILTKEKKRWRVYGLYQHAWFERLRARDPKAAAGFEQELDRVKLLQPRPPIKSSSVFLFAPASGGLIIGFCAAKIIGFTLPFTILCTLVLGAAGIFLGSKLHEHKQKNALQQDRLAYMSQLHEAGDRIAAIVRHADSIGQS